MIAALDEDEVADWLLPMASAHEQTVLAESADGSVLGWVRFGDEPDDPREGAHLLAVRAAERRRPRASGGRLLEHGIERCAAQGARGHALGVRGRTREPAGCTPRPGSRPTAAAASSPSTARRRSTSRGRRP